jgi:hypothetical protein
LDLIDGPNRHIAPKKRGPRITTLYNKGAS